MPRRAAFVFYSGEKFRLAALALDLANGSLARDFASSIGFKPEEALRFYWGMGIVNTVTAMMLVCVDNNDTAQSIILPMQEAYDNALIATGPATVRIGDFIVDEEEKRFLLSSLTSSMQGGHIDDIDKVETNIRSLTDAIYDRRQEQYGRALIEGMTQVAKGSPGSSFGPMFHVARRFAVHLTSEEDLAISLSILLRVFFEAFMDYCRGELRK